MSLIVRSLFLRNSLISSNLRRLNSSYKTPLNSKKVFEPNTVAVTKANRHLNVELLDEHEKSLGKVNLEQAKQLADGKLLKLVCIEEGDESMMPRFKLMSGKDLHKLRMELRDNVKKEKAEGILKNVKEKEIDINLGIDDHDLGVKLKSAEQMHNKGHLVSIKVYSKRINRNEVDITKFQNDFIKKLESLIKFGNLKVEKRTENMINLTIQQK